jgi:hypothetical protein
MASKQQPNVLFCTSNRTKSILLVSGMLHDPAGRRLLLLGRQTDRLPNTSVIGAFASLATLSCTGCKPAGVPAIAETNRLHCVLCSMQNRTFGPCLATRKRMHTRSAPPAEPTCLDVMHMHSPPGRVGRGDAAVVGGIAHFVLVRPFPPQGALCARMYAALQGTHSCHAFRDQLKE